MTETQKYQSILSRAIRFGRIRMRERCYGYPAVVIYGNGKYLERELDLPDTDHPSLMKMMREAGFNAARHLDRIEYVFLVSDGWVYEPQAEEFRFSPWFSRERKHVFMVSSLKVRGDCSEALLFDVLPEQKPNRFSDKPFCVLVNEPSIYGHLSSFMRGFDRGLDVYEPQNIV